MAFTLSELRTNIKKLKCRYSQYMTDYAHILKYGLCGSDCKYIKAFLVNSYIKIFEKFTEDYTCTCTLSDSEYLVTRICKKPAERGFCYDYYNVSGPAKVIDSTWGFSAGTLTYTNALGITTTTTYTLSGSTLVITTAPFFGVDITATVTFSADCESLTFVIIHDSIEYTIYFSAITTNLECGWAETCHTEEEIEDLIKYSSSLLGSKCNC